ncbi:PREDICTED: lamin-like protein [Nelumbo nucifera]|uniref:Lamin-like protein n=2 Tax=Nelumbo nucifera TaxID=4432 RepID=A0A1U7ZY93_NELNU|nr:PREDICTED: lamin-like protein [Nelumbo nucifera]DAD34968.1 TPA_asm: hypothetical protein HUJ06_005608 [Nelumbo nucifera]
MEVVRRVPVMKWTMLLVLSCGRSVSGDLLRVGGSANGWNPDVNYTEWAGHQYFYVGLWLYFGYDRHYFNVLEVNKTSYETCNDGDPITNVSRGAGRDVFNLREVKTYYFLSGGGYCWHGMKLAVPVHQFPLLITPAPSPSKNSSPSSNRRIILPTGIATAVVVWIINSLFNFWW